MRKKRHTPEEIISKLRQVDVLVGQGTPVADAVRSIEVTEVTADFLIRQGIRARSIEVRPQASNAPEEAIKTASRLAARLASRPQLLSTRQRLDIGVRC